MEDKIKLLKAELGENRVKENVDISEYLETKLDGIATAFYLATTNRELVWVIELCQELKIKYLLIGAGSKIAINDEDLSGLVIKNRSDALKIYGVKGRVSREGIGIEEALLEADSGVSLKRLAEYASGQKLGGFEVLKDIMGTVGGSILMNEVLLDKCFQVKVLPDDGEITTLAPFQIHKNDVVLSAVFKLKAKKI